MASYPEPCYGVVVHDAYGPVTTRYSHRPDILWLVDALKS